MRIEPLSGDQALRGLDLRLLRTALVLLTECSVSRAAQIVGQSQPAVSVALKRLREVFGDRLLVRSGSRLVPTERGLEVRDAVARALAKLDAVLAPPQLFDPSTSTRRLRVVAANCLGAFLLPRIVELVRTAAPRMAIDLCAAPSDDHLVAALESGEIDLVVGNWPDPPPNLRYAPLFQTEIACMVRPAHPLARRRAVSIDEYLELDHLSPSPPTAAATSPIDGRLARLGLARRVAVSVPEYTVVPYVLARTDVVFTTGRPFAEHLAAMMPFSVLSAPPELGRMAFYMLWHDRSHASPFGRWLRGLIRTAAAEVEAVQAPGEPDARRISATA